ncbi:hypothetical protein [Flavobacterium ardleyense]|uniref:hypothetical protein n=1 Tax=Flavobacterium ardleyense TaxID=2038737 RepID=UPI00298BE08B|nr:hypothetical protein [Flavobacterium ardleyense]
MELKQTIENLNFPNKYQDVINKIDLNKTNDFVKAMLNTIVKKYGISNVGSEIRFDNSNSKVSTHLTHIIEVGGLKIISDNNLNIDDKNNFQNIIVAVALVLNCSLAIELKNLKIYDGRSSNYYNNDALLTIVQRLANHTISGMSYSNGFEHHATLMIMNNLVSQLTD